jgi:hypothetical protein
MKKLVPLVLPAILLFACSPGPVSLQPGMWESTVQFTSIDLPGASPQELAAMRAMLSRPQTSSRCITAEEAANPAQRMMNPAGGNACRFSESTFSNGTIRVHGNCQMPGRGPQQTSMEGSFTATTMQATIASQIQAPPGTQGPQTARMSGTLSARRTGDCPG